MVLKQMSQIGEEKKRPKGLVGPTRNSYLSKISAEHRRTSHHRAASQSLERLLSPALLLLPVGCVSNKAVTEKANLLRFGDPPLHVPWNDEERHETKALPRRPSQDLSRPFYWGLSTLIATAICVTPAL